MKLEMPELPIHIPLVFMATTLLALILFYWATRSRWLLIIALALGTAQGVLSYQGFFFAPEAIPPRILFVIMPAVILILIAFTTRAGRLFMDGINMERYTWLHIVRIPVELVILWLSLEQLMPESMSFEGRNFDIFSGITAPIIAYWGLRKGKIGKGGLLAWNVLCLMLVLQVVVTGVFSAPSPFQQLDFDQPNVGVLYFPYVWLPGIIVPMVIFGHLAAIRRLVRG